MELIGRVKVVMDTQTFDSGFTKREFVITTREQYPQDINLECIKDRITMLDDIQVGEEVNVQFNIKGREYNGRYFVNLQAWKIDKVADTQPDLPSAEVPPDTLIPEEGEDDLPF